jgi:hypothetical protein
VQGSKEFSMRQFFRNAAIVAVILAVTGTALAGPKNGPGSKPAFNKSPYGFTFGNYWGYRHGYTSWTSTIYSTEYACNLYYDPITGLWYFWCPARNCYLPVSLWVTYHP